MKVMVEVHVGKQGLLAIEVFTPEGDPETVMVTGWVTPATRVLVIVFWVKTLPLLLLVALELPELERE